MADYQVTCITPDGADRDRRIDRLGGIRITEGGTWNDTIDNVLVAIQAGHRFFVEVMRQRVRLYVKRSVAGRLFVTTEPDGIRQNNLSHIARCR